MYGLLRQLKTDRVHESFCTSWQSRKSPMPMSGCQTLKIHRKVKGQSSYRLAFFIIRGRRWTSSATICFRFCCAGSITQACKNIVTGPMYMQSTINVTTKNGYFKVYVCVHLSHGVSWRNIYKFIWSYLCYCCHFLLQILSIFSVWYSLLIHINWNFSMHECLALRH